MERIRTNGIGDVRRALIAAHDMRRLGRERDIEMRGISSAEIQQRRKQSVSVFDAMVETHRDWVTAKFEPRLLYLQRNAQSDEERQRITQSVESSYKTGLQIAVTLYSKIKGGDFDMQDVIVAYTGDFLRMLHICEKLQIEPGYSLSLAQRSYIFDAQSFVRLLQKFEGRFQKKNIVQAVIEQPNRFEASLVARAQTVIAMAEHPSYPIYLCA